MFIKKYIEKIVLFLSFVFVIGIFWAASELIHETTSSTARLSKILTNQDGVISRALFSPQDTIKEVVINLIEHEQKRVSLAIYSFTDPDIAKALIDAHERGIRVEVVVDRGYAADKFSRVNQLANAKIFVTVYQPPHSDNSNTHCIMHNKFFIFEKNVKNKQILLTGSFNCTRSANASNKENVLVIEEPNIIGAYYREFNQLKKSCLPISGQAEKYLDQEKEGVEDSTSGLLSRILGVFFGF